MIIQAIQYPYIITDDGCRIAISEIEGNVIPGSTLELTSKGYKVKGIVDVVCEM